MLPTSCRVNSCRSMVPVPVVFAAPVGKGQVQNDDIRRIERRRLQALGATPGVFVGVCLPPSVVSRYGVVAAMVFPYDGPDAPPPPSVQSDSPRWTVCDVPSVK